MNLINTYVLLTFLLFLVFYSFRKSYFGYLFTVLFLSLTNEVIFIAKPDIYPITSSFYVNILFICWFLMLRKALNFSGESIKIILAVFIGFSLANAVFIEKEGFHKISFVVGSFMYLSTYIFFSFNRLKKEELGFFLSNEFLLISAPILFFLGLSFLFGFRSYELTSTIVFGSITLYKVITVFVNAVYYTLLNIFIFKERKKKYA